MSCCACLDFLAARSIDVFDLLIAAFYAFFSGDSAGCCCCCCCSCLPFAVTATESLLNVGTEGFLSIDLVEVLLIAGVPTFDCSLEGLPGRCSSFFFSTEDLFKELVRLTTVLDDGVLTDFLSEDVPETFFEMSRSLPEFCFFVSGMFCMPPICSSWCS